MPNYFRIHAVRAILLALGAVIVGCEGRAPSGPARVPVPSSTSPPAVGAPVVTSIEPNSGPSTGGTIITVKGGGFEAGTKVILGGLEAQTYPVDSSTVIRLPLPQRPAGKVDVAVINPDGQSANLREGFTYQDPPAHLPGPQPSITSVSPSAGITGGGTHVQIAGTGFAAGATVTFGGVVFRPNVFDNVMGLQTLPHTAGSVDVVVTNPDGQSTTLAGAYRFADPESLNFNGNWEGRAGHHWDFVVTFTIENNLLTRVSCNGGAEHLFSAPPSTIPGEFSDPAMSGKFFSAGYGTGTVSIANCVALQWEAWKLER